MIVSQDTKSVIDFLNYRWEQAKIKALTPGVYGEFGVKFRVANGKLIEAYPIVQPVERLPGGDKTA